MAAYDNHHDTEHARKPGRLRRAMGFAFPHRKAVFGIFFITLLLAGANAAEPLIFKYLFDDLAARKVLHTLLVGVGVLALIGIFREAATGLTNWMTTRTRLGLHYVLFESTLECIHRMPPDFHRAEGVGAVMTKLDRSIQGFIGAVTQILFNIFPALLYLLISVGIMLRLNWKLTAIVLGFLPLPAIIAAFSGPEQTRRERNLLDQWSRIFSRLSEVLSGLVTVRSFSMEDTEQRRLLRDVHRANEIVSRGVGIDSGIAAATNMVVTLARITALGIGGYLIIHGRMSLGTLVAFQGYVGSLFGPVQSLTGIYQTVQRAYVSLDEIFKMLDVEDHLEDAPDARELTHVRGEVNFQSVKFAYDRSPQPLLKGVDLKVNPGEKVAIVGPNGSGKTTLMNLLLRFHDPHEGSIHLDGQDLRTLKQRSLRQHIGSVLQDPILFNDSVRNNIAYARPDASMAEIERAAQAAHAHEFIARLPDGYDTPVGERGERLSVGERQRITIARAILKNPRILILDEATSALDPESEGAVNDALEHLIKDRTTFVVAHRLSTVVNADRIIVLKHGRIVESGQHHELMRSKGYYSSLVARQTCGLLRNDGEPGAAFQA